MPAEHPSAAADKALTDNQQRPLVRTSCHTADAPLIVTPTFLTRADDTPRAVRPMDAGSTRGLHGESIENPDATFIDLARSEFWTGLNYSVINRLLPELATRR